MTSISSFRISQPLHVLHSIKQTVVLSITKIVTKVLAALSYGWETLKMGANQLSHRKAKPIQQVSQPIPNVVLTNQPIQSVEKIQEKAAIYKKEDFISSRISKAEEQAASTLTMIFIEIFPFANTLSELLSTYPTGSRSLILTKWMEVNIEEIIKIEELDLSNRGFTILPKHIGKFTALKSLSLAYNAIEVITDSLSSLTELKVLDLSNNNLKIISNSFGQLENLKTLYLNGNPHLNALPDSFINLRKVQQYAYDPILGTELKRLAMLRKIVKQ